MLLRLKFNIRRLLVASKEGFLEAVCMIYKEHPSEDMINTPEMKTMVFPLA